MKEETFKDIRENAYQEMFDFINWLAVEHPDEWSKYIKEYGKRADK